MGFELKIADIVSNSEVESVILEDDSTPSPKQAPARVHHFFTFNNYDSADIYILEKCLGEICYMFCFQEECVETPHLQGVISLKKRGRWTEFGLPRKIHWEAVRDVTASYRYCSDFEKRTGGIWTKNFQVPYHFSLTNFFPWQQDILKTLSSEPDDRSVWWFWSERGGIGKSTFVKHLIMNKNAIALTKGRYSDVCNLIFKTNMDKCRCVIFDLPRNNGNRISYDAIESIKNGMIVNMKYETGGMCFRSPHVLVFANSPPNEEALSNDRWHVREL